MVTHLLDLAGTHSGSPRRKRINQSPTELAQNLLDQDSKIILYARSQIDTEWVNPQQWQLFPFNWQFKEDQANWKRIREEYLSLFSPPFPSFNFLPSFWL